MSTHDTDAVPVLDALRDSFDRVTLHAPVEQIVTAGRIRRRRRRVVRTAAGVTTIAALAIGMPGLTHSSAPPGTGLSTETGTVHIHTAAFTLDSHADGTVRVTWDKRRYFEDHEGLQQALRKAGFPVLIKEGVFCKAPQDDGSLDPSGVGPGVREVMRAEGNRDAVSFVFVPAAMPAGKQLFIGYLNPAQLAVTHGRPGSVERLVSATAKLTCTTQAPAPKPDANEGNDPPAPKTG
jgi:hypothetical protein